MTTKDVIKLLPIDEALRIQVLNVFDYLEPDQKLSIERIAWKMYDMMEEEQIELAVQEQYDAVKEGKAELGKQFYAEAVQKAEQQMTKHISTETAHSDLEAARLAMHKIVSEISAAKKAPKHA